jgi:hypothetical protein
MLQVDSCNRNVDPAHWAVFRDAINSTGRPMVLRYLLPLARLTGVTHSPFSIIAQGQNGTIQAGSSIGNLWRTTNDIMDRWGGVISNLDTQSTVPGIAGLAAPG